VSVGADAVAEFRRRLADWPGVEVVEGDGEVTAKGTVGGFDVLVYDDGEEAIVFGDYGVHAHFDDPAAAVDTALAMLTGECRLVLRRALGAMVSARIERRGPDGTWRCVGIMGFCLLFPLGLLPIGRSLEVRTNAHPGPSRTIR
jgi:hypothetical protein